MSLFPFLSSSLIARKIASKHSRPSELTHALRLHLSCVRELHGWAIQGRVAEAWVLTELIQATGGVSTSPWISILGLVGDELQSIERQAQSVNQVQFFAMCIAGQVNPAAKVVVWHCYMCSSEMANSLGLTERDLEELF